MVGVVLGMPGPWADSNYEQADHYSSKIGGVPDWPFPLNSKVHNFLECNACGRNLCLIAQVYAPISFKNLTVEERVIYVFGCVIPHCESILWRALRVQKTCSIQESTPFDEMPESSLSVSKTNFLDDLWSFNPVEVCDNSDDDIDLEELGRALSEAANFASVGQKQSNNSESGQKQSNNSESSTKPLPVGQPAINDNISVMPCFYIYAQEEKLVRKFSSETAEYSLPSVKEYESNSEDHSNDDTYEEENYEYDRALNADRTYLKFKKRMDEYPEQCFRYSYGGKPLLASGGVGDPGTCRHCGEQKHFEMQLMPPLIYFLLEAADELLRTSVEKLDWMTLLVYTCSKSCSGDHQEKFGGSEDWTVTEEEVLVQYE